MKITIISGQSKYYHLDKFYKDESIEGQRYFFPEIVGADMLQEYDIMEKVMEKCDIYLKRRQSLVIFTYSKVVLDSVRVWAVKNKCCDIVRCVNLLKNGETSISKLDKNGELIHPQEGVFDFERYVENELQQLRKQAS